MQSPNRFYYTWRLLFLHQSFAWCFFFYLSFLFPPVEPGVFNCCETNKKVHRNSIQNYGGLLVPVTGVEPVRCRHHRILSPARLPIPSHRRVFTTDVLYTIPSGKSRENSVSADRLCTHICILSCFCAPPSRTALFC